MVLSREYSTEPVGNSRKAKWFNRTFHQPPGYPEVVIQDGSKLKALTFNKAFSLYNRAIPYYKRVSDRIKMRNTGGKKPNLYLTEA